jgi:toxin ParE1/3/4
MSRLVLAPAARDDLDAIHSHISADNSEAADRVLDSAFETFGALIRNPELGRVREFTRARLGGLRSIGVRSYPNYVIFYRTRQATVEIVRVLHGARDFDGLFGGE